ncbi:glycosyltransferase family 4 protein [Mesorhizobium sp. SP-1A]|uniref:glycosyltransferase family 4 protein n=1 Tax=Mesorhizobium sp. SP-1A TaxID=3077840 RepID=UPI0028F74BB8|nr:glycosyltransferase family 4 protein [Mesorhizobium sp. SP-1A]
MTVDAVGGVWQYAMALAEQLSRSGEAIVLAGLGPPPSAEQKAEAEAFATLVWLKTPPDWMARTEAELAGLRREIAELLRDHAIDLAHLNEPGQAVGLDLPCPVVAVSHSCIGTWFRAVRNEPPPPEWTWHFERTRTGLEQADLVVAPSASHAAALDACYQLRRTAIVVHNAVKPPTHAAQRKDTVFAAGRWWDDGKNARVLDRASTLASWPIIAAGPGNGPNGTGFVFRSANGLGPVSHAEIRERMACCGIFVSPSLYEPFGLAALEAATAGTPLVLADIPTYRELWSGAAAFFPPGDAQALAQTLNCLIEDAPLRHALGAAALRRSLSFTLARQATAMRAAYERATSVHAGRC